MTPCRFIVFEGPDGSGTTRQSSLFAARLQAKGESVLRTAEPTDSKIGMEIRELLHGDVLPSPEAIQLLFCADRAHHVSTVIEPALRQGTIVISDRYALSTILYGSTQGISKDWLLAVNAPFPKPDLTFILLPPFDVCMERILRRERRDFFEMENFQRRVYEQYKSVEDPGVIFVDTTASKEEVADYIMRQYQEHFSQSANLPA